jgi:hypothetical protein
VRRTDWHAQFLVGFVAGFTFRQAGAGYDARMKKDHRTKARRPVHYKAWLQTAEDATAKPCSFSDVSEGGARLQIEGAEAVPGEVQLRVAENSEGRPCHVVWRSETEIGLRFDQPATAENARHRR